MNLKSFLKFLERNKLYTVINVIGLSISLMFVILIGIYVVQELSVDKFQKDGNRIYVLGNLTKDGNFNYRNALPIAYRVQERYPEIEKVCPLLIGEGYNKNVTLGKNAEQSIKADILMADSAFFSFFSFPLKIGTKEKVLESMQSVVISESFAKRAFGNDNPIGKPIFLTDSLSVIVSGVMKDIKHSAVPSADAVIRIEHAPTFNGYISLTNYNNAGSTVAFLKLKQGADLSGKLDDMQKWFKTFYWIYSKDFLKMPTLTKLNDIYFSGVNSCLNSGDRKFVMILMSVGFVILLFSIINYINLTMAQAGFRVKGMAVRRLLGSSRKTLLFQLLLESFLMVLLSLVIGIILAKICELYVNNLLQTEINLQMLTTPLGIASIALVVILLSVLSGFFPAIVISNAKPIEVVRGTFRRQTKMVFSKVFITLQNIVTIVMIACSLTMYLQIRHLINAPLGYNKDNIIEMDNDFDKSEQKDVFINEVNQLACVKRIGQSQGTPFNRGDNRTGNYEGHNISSQLLVGDSSFFNMFGFNVIHDNQLALGEGVYVNQEFVRKTGISENKPSFIYNENEIKIAGIIDDFQMANVTNVKVPVQIRLNKSINYPWNLLIQVQGNPYDAYRKVATIYKRITKYEFSGKYIDEEISESFESQRRTAKIVTIFAVIAVLISLLGLLAMSTYFIRQRMKEVAVRKVFGSTNKEVLTRLVRTFLSYVVIAFIISVPFIWYFMRGWLSDYSYRISLSVWIYIVAGLFCLVVSFSTVFWQALYAARRNPVKSLKNE